MYFYPKLDDKIYPKSSKLITKIFLNKRDLKSDYKDKKISKEIINFYDLLKKNSESKSEWTWINKKKRSEFINSLEEKNYLKTSNLLANCFRNNTSFGIISWHWSKFKEKSDKEKFVSHLTKDYLAWSEFTKENNYDENYLDTKKNFGNFYGLIINKKKIMIDTPRHDYYSSKIMDLLTNIKKNKKFLVEIGGGYGGLIFQLLKRNFKDVYLNVDILETLLINYYFLRKYTKKKIIICDLENPKKFNNKNIYLSTRSYFSKLKSNIDVVFNSNSFSEMSKKDVKYYFKYINLFKSKYIYHQNSDVLLYPNSLRHIEILAKDFPVNKKKYKLILKNMSLWGSGSGRYREYLYKRF